MSSSTAHTGGCRCGSVRFAAQAEPFHVSYCHCVDCRHATGAPYAAFVGFESEAVQIKGKLSEYGQNGIARGFCAACGAPLTYADMRLEGQIYFLLGAMDRPQDFEPTLHAYMSQKLPYVHLSDGLPQLARTSVPRPDGTNP